MRNAALLSLILISADWRVTIASSRDSSRTITVLDFPGKRSLSWNIQTHEYSIQKFRARLAASEAGTAFLSEDATDGWYFESDSLPRDLRARSGPISLIDSRGRFPAVQINRSGFNEKAERKPVVCRVAPLNRNG
jgi:hypothetical protein